MNKPCELNGFVQSAVHKYSQTVVKIAFSYLKNTADAEDITLEVFLSLMQKQSEFENEEHLKAWLIRVVINKCMGGRYRGYIFDEDRYDWNIHANKI